MITITNLTTNPVDEEYLKSICQKVLKEEGEKEPQLSVVLVGQGRMKQLNKKYRGKNRVTDVLAFPSNRTIDFVTPPNEESELGEIVLCMPVLKKNAKRLNSTLEKELTISLIHGILHLLGYDHEKNASAAKKMEEKQQYYLNQFIAPS